MAVKGPARSVGTASDLHLFCKRSQAGLHMDRLDAVIRQSELFVLNGDLFDFKWSIYQSQAETVRAALSWLQALLKRHPHCHFHYVLGNHDCLKAFTAALSELEANQPRLTCHPHFVRLGEALFLHGDVAMGLMDSEGLEAYRKRWYYHKRKGRLLNLVYDAAFSMNVHHGVHRVAFPHSRVLKRVRHYIEEIGQGPSSGVTTVYFGHTHVPLSGVHYEGIEFHNGGAALRGVEFNILSTQV